MDITKIIGIIILIIACIFVTILFTILVPIRFTTNNQQTIDILSIIMPIVGVSACILSIIGNLFLWIS